MKKFKIEVLKIGDIHHEDVSPNLLAFIQNGAFITYKDQVLNEDIYNMNDTLDEIEAGTCECPEEITEELNQMVSALHKKDVGYLRITY